MDRRVYMNIIKEEVTLKKKKVEGRHTEKRERNL